MKIKLVDSKYLAKSFSFGLIKRIFVSKRFFKLTDGQQTAVLLHEKAHCDGHHTEIRFFFLLFAPFMLRWVCKKQELAADRAVVRAGFAEHLLELLADDRDGGEYHPSNKVRRENLKFHDQARIVPVKDPLSTGLT